jgi:phospholipid-binding lipoprotein MlaA
VLHSPALRTAALQPRGVLVRTHRVAAQRAARLAAVLLGLILLGGCATPPSNDPEALEAYKEANDPLEPMNRYFFELNYAADELLFKPLAGWYYVALPNFAQDGVRNALRNVRSPVVLANDLFQGETDRAGVTVSRFLVNSTMGIGGLFDIASRMGLEYHDEDFGQTLAVHGVGEGPYLMLPLLGPSNPRDAAGRVVDMLFDPLTYIGIFAVDNIGLGAAVVDGMDTRARNLKTLDEIRKGSLDYYATIRSLYRQRRNDEINNGKTPEGGAPGLGDDQQSARPAGYAQVSAAEPLVPRRPKLAKALPLFIIKEPAGPLPALPQP